MFAIIRVLCYNREQFEGVSMTKEEMIKYKKIRFLQIVKEEYERPKKDFIKKIPLMSDEELEDEADNIIVGKEVREEIEKRKSYKKL